MCSELGARSNPGEQDMGDAPGAICNAEFKGERVLKLVGRRQGLSHSVFVEGNGGRRWGKPLCQYAYSELGRVYALELVVPR